MAYVSSIFPLCVSSFHALTDVANDSFMGNDQFCFKACDPAGSNARRFCEHIYDRIGCQYNAPNAAQKGQYTSCEGEDQDFLCIYTCADR